MAVDFPNSPSNGQTFTSNGLTFTWNGSAWKLDPSSGTKGEKGQKGEVGEKGSKGDKGIKGEVGDKGQKGEIGPAGGSGGAGVKGDKGQKGELNDKGQKGDTGSSGSATITNNADNRVITGGTGTNLNGEANLTFDGSKLRLPDNIELQLGTDGATSGNGDLRIFHDGESKIWDNGNGGIVLQTGSSHIEMRAIGQPGDEAMFKAHPNGSVDLYEDATLRFQTTPTGAKVFGNLEVSGAVTGTGALIPSGGIIIWSGSVSNIPSGWYLCDGSNSTPDLRNRFVVGAHSDGANTDWPNLPPGNTGGSNVSSLPSHNHSFSSSHTHSFSATTGTDSHTHSYSSANHPTSGGPEQNQSGGPEDRTTFNVGKTTGSDSHSHSVSGTTGSGTASGTTGNQGSAGSKSNLPPYYALCYIMKS